MAHRSTALSKVLSCQEKPRGHWELPHQAPTRLWMPLAGPALSPWPRAVLGPRWTALGLCSDAASSTGKPPAPPPLEPTATEFAGMTPDAACQEGVRVLFLVPLRRPPRNPQGPAPRQHLAGAQAAHCPGCPLPRLGLLTWAGRAPGCRPPAALGGAAPGTGCPAGSPRPCPPRGPGHSTGSSAPPLLHSSGCRPPACTATWGKQESGGVQGEPGFPSRPPQTGKGLENVLSLGSHCLHREEQCRGQRTFRRPRFAEGEVEGRSVQKSNGEGAGHPRGPAETSVSNRNPSLTITRTRPARTPNLLPHCVSTSHQHCPSDSTYTHIHIYIFPSIVFVMRPPAPSPRRLLREHGAACLSC